MLQLFMQAGWVAWPLGFCSILAIGVVLERLWTLSRLRTLEERAVMVLQLGLEKGDTSVLRDPTVASAPVSIVLDSVTSLKDVPGETFYNAADIQIALQRVRLRRYTGTLATIGATAPFIGLFGTVIGIMIAFEGMSVQGLSGERMAQGISEALSATALGLVVAVPSVIFYNYFVGRIQAFVLTIQGHVARLAPLLRSVEQVERV